MQRLSTRSVSKRSRLSIVFPFVFLLLSPVWVHAEWYKDYDEGLKASNKGQWQQAILHFQSAIRVRQNEEINVRFYGTKMDDYFPHFYLGIAYYNIKNFEAAVSEFQISEAQAAVKERPRLVNQLTSLQTLARAQLASARNPSGAPEKTIEAPAVPVVQQPQAVSGSEGSKTPQENTSPQPAKEQVPAEIKPQASQPDTEAFKKSMRSGAKRYFEGNFDGAIRNLLYAINIDRNQAAAYFLLGCSYASKYLLTGSQDQKLFEKASSAFQKSKQIDPQYGTMKSAYISPAVVEIYQKTSG